MTIGIGIQWHMTCDGKANANRVVEGSLRLYEGDNDYMNPTLDIYLESPANAALAAAAINGDLAELRRLLDMAAPVPAEDVDVPDDWKHDEYLRQKAEQI